MKRKIKSLIGFTIHATDGEIGKVKDFYFDDRTWTIRYLIFPVNLTMAQIKASPKTDTHKPISRQHEMDLYGYYPWGNYYWGDGMDSVGVGMSYPIALNYIQKKEADASVTNKSDDDPHLRSIDAVTGYNIKATDGEIGDVEDFIINDHTWSIDFMEVDTGNWFPGKKVLVSPQWIKEINWETSSVIVNASENQVKNSPEYVPSQDISDSDEANLHKYYEFITHK